MTAARSNSHRRPQLHRVLLIVPVAAAVAALALWAFWPHPIEVDGARVVRGEMRAWVEEQAITRVPRIYQVSMPIDGRVMPISVLEGDRVRHGEVVARLEVDELESDAAAAEARLARIRAQLEEAADTRLELTALDQVNEFLVSLDRTVEAAEERTRSSRARQDFAADQLRRAEAAFEAGAMTPTELERARLDAVDAEVGHRADVLTLRATMATRAAARILPRFIQEYIELRSHRRSVLLTEQREAEEAMARIQRDLGRASVESPIDGVVFNRAVADRTVISAGALLLEIGRPEDLEIEAEVLSEEAVRISIGAGAEVFGGAVGQPPVGARVSRIYPQGFTKISALGIEQQRVLVVLEFAPGELAALAERGRRLGSDYRVRVRILADHRDAVLRIPRTAVFRGPDGVWQAFIVAAGRAELVTLQVGLMTPQDVEVVDGLREGDVVVLSPPGQLRAGQRARPVDR